MAIKFNDGLHPPPTPDTPSKGGEVLPPLNVKAGSAAYKEYMGIAKNAQTLADKVGNDKFGKERVDLAVHRLIAEGKVHPQPARDLKKDPVLDRTDPKLIEEFTRLMLVGANAGAVRAIMQLTQQEYDDLRKAALESSITELSNDGILGTIAQSFSVLQEGSRRALQVLAGLDDEPKNRNDLLNTIRLVKEMEQAKIDLLIRTGAVKVKKHVQIDANFGVKAHNNIDTFNSEKARTVMVQVASLLTAGLEGSDDDEEDAVVITTP